MKHPTARLHLFAPSAAVLGLVLFGHVAVAGKPAVEGYADYDAYRLQLESIAASQLATLQSLGRTRGRREVYLLKIGSGKVDQKPAVLIVGSVDPPHLLGSELAVRIARRMVRQAKADKAVRKMLDRLSFYIIPRPSPDACEAFFRRPYHQRAGNQRPTDDDRDGQLDEDGPDDLDGDGRITMMRVSDPTGRYMPDPRDARVLIKADAKQNERGRYRLFVEGRDNDDDDAQGEDPPGGVAFNRNFTFRYAYFGEGAGPHQVSEVETRAVADFAYDHPNIAAVLTFTPEDNLMRPWKPDSDSESQRIKTAVLSDDAPYFDFVAQQYREIHGGEDPPESAEGEGSFSEWAYFHYGRWSFACRGWWIPKVETDENGDMQDKEGVEDKEESSEKDAPDRADSEEDDEDEESEEESAEKERVADQLNALRWFAREGIDGFLDWTKIEHPDFPDKRVEVGGFRPFLRLNPPAEQLEPLAKKHWQFVCKLAELLPRVVIQEAEAEPLGGGVWRVKAVAVNRGYLPTVSQMGLTTRQPQRLQIELELPDGVSLVTGHPRLQLSPLAGHGGKAESTWLVIAEEDKPIALQVRVWSASVGTTIGKVRLRRPKPAGKKKARKP